MFKPPLTKTRIALAFSVAIFADALQIPIRILESNAIIDYLGIPVHFLGIPIDLFAAAVTIILIGFHPALLPSFIVKIVPAVAGLPTWTAAVGYVVWSRKHEAAPETSPVENTERPVEAAEIPSPSTRTVKAGSSGIWILVLGAVVIGAFLWVRHAPAKRHRKHPPVAAQRAPADNPTAPVAEEAPPPTVRHKSIVAVGPIVYVLLPTGISAITGLTERPASFQPQNGSQSRINSDAICSVIEDQLAQIDGVEVMEKQQMQLLQSQMKQSSDDSEKVRLTDLLSHFSANAIVLVAVLDVHSNTSQFRGYGVQPQRDETVCLLRVQVMNASDGTIRFSRSLRGSIQDSRSGTTTVTSTEDRNFAVIKKTLGELNQNLQFKNAVLNKPLIDPGFNP
jgi:hypothetical protein